MSEVIYNVTVAVSEAVNDEWLVWMREQHIPDVLRTGMFYRATLLRIHAFEQGGISYAIQYHSDDMAKYERYLQEFAPALRAASENRFGDQVHAFRTLLEVLDTIMLEPAKQ